MAKRKITNKTYPILTMLIGLISFLIIGIIIGLGLKNAGLVLILGATAGSLLMLFILGKLDKRQDFISYYPERGWRFRGISGRIYYRRVIRRGYWFNLSFFK